MDAGAAHPDHDQAIIVTGIRRSVEGWMAPFSKKLGWRPDFTLDTLMSGSCLKVEELQTVPPFGLFSLLHCRRDADALA